MEAVVKLDEEICNFHEKTESDNISIHSNDEPQHIINVDDYSEECTNLTNEISSQPKVNSRTQSRTERIWDQFISLEEQVFQNEIADPGLALIDHLIRLQDEDAEKNKNSYLHFLDIYKKNKDIFKNKILESYLKCRKKMQVDYGVYIPNIAQAAINIDRLALNTHVPPEKLKGLGKKYNKAIVDQRNILYKSRCIANGVAFINRNPLIKEGLYWELKRKLRNPLQRGFKKGAKTISDVFLKHCYIIGEQYIKHETGSLKKQVGYTLQQIISAIQNPPSLKSLVSVYSISHLHNTFGEKDMNHKMSSKVNLKPVKRPITQIDAVQLEIAKKLKSVSLIDISSSESEDGETCTVVVKSEKTLLSSSVDPELKFVDDLIKFKDKEYEELKKDYMQLTEKYTLAGSLEDFDIDSYLECREKLQIACGMYIPNVVYPDICPSDAKFYESCFTSRKMSRPEILKWSMRSNVEECLFKSKCIANGLSIINKDSVLKRQVYQRISLANKVSDNKSLKMLSVVLEEELNGIGRAHSGSKSSEMYPNKHDILSEILSRIKSFGTFKNIFPPASIYSPDYEPDSIKYYNVNDPVASSVHTLEGISSNHRMMLRSSGAADITHNTGMEPTYKKENKETRKTGRRNPPTEVAPNAARRVLSRFIREQKCRVKMPNISKKKKEKYEKNLARLIELRKSKPTCLPLRMVKFMNEKRRKSEKRMIKPSKESSST